MDAQTIAVPVWLVGVLLFVFGMLVGKMFFEPPGIKRTRPPTPPNPYSDAYKPPSYPRPPMPQSSAGWQPLRANSPDLIKPPPKNPQISVEQIEEEARKAVEAFKGIEGSIGATGDELERLFKGMKPYGKR